ncbi:hypothetical protein [Pedobacter sp. JCM 36344]|uniref:hypothetical protein n=1 Tax=Pedobacter sp. JCM 36344 TaxID=3374280 RepID=UPI0039783945
MEDLNNLQTLWQSARPSNLPDGDKIQKNIKRFRWIKLRNKVFSVTVSVLVILASLALLATDKDLLMSTKIALACNIAACAILVITNLRSMKRFTKLKDFSNLEFLQFLHQTRRNQAYYHKRTEVAGLILITISSVLFPYEFTVHSIVLTIITYVIVLSWIMTLWFYIRPRSFSKHSRKLSAELTHFENIIKQTR